MLKKLITTKTELFHFVDGVKIDGVHSEITADVSRLTGDVTGLTGDVTGLFGNLDECDITDEERTDGINISDLII